VLLSRKDLVTLYIIKGGVRLKNTSVHSNFHLHQLLFRICEPSIQEFISYKGSITLCLLDRASL